MYYIIVFKSRQEALDLRNKLKNINVDSRTVNTPRTISTSCGISLQVYKTYIDNTIKIIKRSSYNTFIGVYLTNSDASYSKVIL